jgi:endonuclease/exonuclease/phosphatase family metal-dependent hydrolase
LPTPRPIVERPPGGLRLDVRTIAARAGLHLFYAPAMRNSAADERGPREDRGGAILSTIRLDELAVIELPFEHQRRVALAATVAGHTPAGAPWQLRVVDVQLDTALALTRGGPFAARRRQAEALLDALGREPPGTPAILGGDLNTWFGSREPAVALLRRAFPDTPRAPNVATWRGPLGAHAALDHVFVRGRFRSIVTRRLPDRFGSDHYPLLTILEF